MKLLVVITIALAVIDVNAVRYSGGFHRVVRQDSPPVQDEDCEECSKLAENALSKMKPQLEKKEPMDMDGQDPCKKCKVSQVSTLQRGGDICAKQDDSGVEQDMRLQMNDLTIICDCMFKGGDGSDVPTKMTAIWGKARIRMLLKIKGKSCSVLKGEVDCDDPNPKCELKPEHLDVTCESDDENAKQSCESQKGDFMVKMMQSAAESMIPNIATETVNENKECIALLACDPDRK